jgi:hypothetical protein
MSAGSGGLQNRGSCKIGEQRASVSSWQGHSMGLSIDDFSGIYGK